MIAKFPVPVRSSNPDPVTYDKNKQTKPPTSTDTAPPAGRSIDIFIMAATVKQHVQLALSLPPRLRTFLARYPPASILPAGADPETHKTPYQEESPNPFMPTKHPITGKWHNPKYSLRRQAELVKLAQEHGVEELLPFTRKLNEEKLRKRVELGLRVKGTGVGEKVKGHKHERTLVAKYVVEPRLLLLVGRKWWFADWGFRTQDGEEERGHAGYARPYPGMEKGKDCAQTFAVCTLVNHGLHYRSARGTGPSSPNKRSVVVACREDYNDSHCHVHRLYHHQQCTTNFKPFGRGCHRCGFVFRLLTERPLASYKTEFPTVVGRQDEVMCLTVQ